MKRGIWAVVFAVLLALVAAPASQAGGTRDVPSVGDLIPSPIPGEVIADLVPTRVNPFCIPLTFKVNGTIDPLHNPLGADFLSVAQATSVLRQAAQAWNDIPTSYMEIRIDGTSTNTGAARLDFINEATFRTPATFRPLFPGVVFARGEEAPIATTRSTVVLQDFFFHDDLDLDKDGDNDVVAGLPTCTDVDGDGDLELPEGFYEAGTLIDFDLVFNTGVTTAVVGNDGYRFTMDLAAADVHPRSVDLMGVAVQLFGLLQGVAHTPTSQTSAANGRSATMFPFVDTSDPAAELALRSLDADAIATASYHYPEGSASTGPAALQPGDLPFDQVFGVITGEVRYGARDEDLAGANVFAVEHSTGEIVGTAISGTSRFSTTPSGATFSFLDAAFHVKDGSYRLVVPPGQYRIGIEPIDGTPSLPLNVNFQAVLGEGILQNDFHEELWNGSEEGALERRPGSASVVSVSAGQTVSGVDIVSNRTIDIAAFGSLDSAAAPGGAAGTYYAVRIPASRFTAADAAAGGDATLQGAELFTATQDDTIVPVFAEALLTTGQVRANGTAVLDLQRPLAKERPFTGQDGDFTPWWFDNSVGLAQRIRNAIRRGEIRDLFLVLRLPEQAPLPQIGLDGGVPANDVPIHGLSFTSTDGVVFTPSSTFNFLFRLVLSEDPH
jgi:hypothetical protein